VRFVAPGAPSTRVLDTTLDSQGLMTWHEAAPPTDERKYMNKQINKYDHLLFFSSFVCISASAYVFKSKVYCGSDVRFGRALPDFPITAHHLYAFLL